jgi:hypothetical protein
MYLQRRRFVRDLCNARSAVRELAVLLARRAARRRVADCRFRPLSEYETTTIVGAKLLAQVAAGGRRT